ncbi:MAG: DinB family protein [Pirellulales bacterium]
MNRFDIARQGLEFQRSRTLALLDKVAQEPDPKAALGFRPGPGRAPLVWQLLHIAVTEELFATERLVPGTTVRQPELVARFRGGSVPDDETPALEDVRCELAESRARLLATLSTFREDQLGWIPPALAQRGLTLDAVLHLLNWHEAHHQGQAHLTFNLYQASRAASGSPEAPRS